MRHSDNRFQQALIRVAVQLTCRQLRESLLGTKAALRCETAPPTSLCDN